MKHPLWLIPLLGLALPAFADETTVVMHKVTHDGPGEEIGTIDIATSATGLAFTLKLHGLSPGQHGFHVHENGSCGPTMMGGVRIPGGAAGSHFDPEGRYKHAGPAGDGHMGDLPFIEAQADGTATATVTAARIADVAAIKGRSLIIHAGGDTYSDTPSLGGGGGRFACGVVE